MKKAVTFIVVLLLLLLLAIAMGWYLVVLQTEPERLRAISRLRLERSANWQDIENYVDCELVTFKMPRQTVEKNLLRLGQYEKSNDLDSDNGRIMVLFKEYPLKHRYYYFRDGLLIGIYKSIGGLDGPERVICPDWPSLVSIVEQTGQPKHPTPMPTPTLPLLDNLLNDWLSGQPCVPPCWTLMTPKETTFAEIYLYVNQSPAMIDVSFFPLPENLFISWQWKELPEKGGEARFDGLESRLISIRLEGAADGSWRLDEVISRYGEPSHVYAAVKEQEEEAYQISLLFLDHGFALLGSDSLKPDLTSDWRADEVLFFEPTKEGFGIGLGEPSVIDKLQPWQGMSSFESYCQEQGCQPSP